ncbi:hypothetical protein FAES_5340 [Fibrella aestuarina BUZ 2]|uniref:DUF1772 domain-containing protein n=1 Tax=Fibrella aestuarina BUZ 2 TaxID=1166018 RepID=I0KGT6_9BACT|nr:anthrone oxygenase family protein [Fibrella aestuarina]CCH03339.1 hypothetical protein FAES_5340 [Fibrella aestuarina BUZ 2]
MSQLPTFFLLLFIVNLGIAFGAGLYETRIVLPLWFQPQSGVGYRVDTAAMQRMDVGRRFWGFVTTMPLSVLTLVNLYYAYQSHPPQQTWWLMASLLMLIERIGTFAFFIPTAIRLEKANSMDASTASRLSRLWMRANYGRSGLNLLGWLFALKAFSLC